MEDIKYDKDKILNKYVQVNNKSKAISFRCSSNLYDRLEYVIQFINHDLEEKGHKHINMSTVFQALLLDEVEKLEHKYRGL